MKIGILTLPFNGNYGGILQAFSLQTVLQKMGLDVKVLKHYSDVYRRLPLKTRYLIYIKRFILKLFFHKDLVIREDKINVKRFHDNMREIDRFISSHLNVLDYNLKSAKLPHFDAIIVGSDQVWRPNYAVPIEKYFLDFLELDSNVRRVAYAASFGTDEWEFTQEQTIRCADLVKKFDLVTVREDSAVSLCKQYFDIEAFKVLDPTMLLDKDEYIQLVIKERISSSNGNLFSYILDYSKQKQDVVQFVAQEKNLTPFSVMLTDEQIKSGMSRPCVLVWLKAFMDAEFVVTDSFHGCVFSIIFNKPFIGIINKNRGCARFNSLLNMFGLQNRLVDLDDCHYALNAINTPIDWHNVNLILEKAKLVSLDYLSKAISI